MTPKDNSAKLNQEEDLSALIEIRKAPSNPTNRDDLTGRLDLRTLQNAERAAKQAEALETRARAPKLRWLLLVMGVACALGWILAQRGWF